MVAPPQVPNIVVILLCYTLTILSSAFATAPFRGLLPDVVTVAQFGSIGGIEAAWASLGFLLSSVPTALVATSKPTALAALLLP